MLNLLLSICCETHLIQNNPVKYKNGIDQSGKSLLTYLQSDWLNLIKYETSNELRTWEHLIGFSCV
jgi:hypothetical protein